jgi:hypothetical protein
MKRFVHARLTEAERAVLEQLRRVTGQSESALIRHGLKLVAEATQPRGSALDLAGRSVGRFKGAPPDLSTSRKHLEGFGR